MKIIYTVTNSGWCGFIKTLDKNGYTLTNDYYKALSVNADNKYKTTPVPNTKHANFWYFQFITLCIDHVFNLYPTTYPSGLGVWCSPYFIDYIVGSVNYGNSNFS